MSTLPRGVRRVPEHPPPIRTANSHDENKLHFSVNMSTRVGPATLFFWVTPPHTAKLRLRNEIVGGVQRSQGQAEVTAAGGDGREGSSCARCRGACG
jgi:hypothetical protein